VGNQSHGFPVDRYHESLALIPGLAVVQDSRYPVCRTKRYPAGVPETWRTTKRRAWNGRRACAVQRCAHCANEGRLTEAIEWCEKDDCADKLNPAHYYLLGTIQQEQGQAEARSGR